MSSQELVIDQLQRLTMSGYEARAYVALISAGAPLNGYEVAKRSGVPRSTVYETLRKLVNRGAVFEVHAGGGTAFLPLPADTLVARLRRDFEESARKLEEALPSVTVPQPAQLLHHINGRHSVLDRAEDMIASAKADLYLSLWEEEIDALRPAITAAEERGVGVFLLAFGDDTEPDTVQHTYQHRFLCADTVFKRVGCRLLVVAADSQSVLIGGAVPSDVWAVYSDDPAVILLAIEYVRHDIGFQVLAKKFGLKEATDLFQFDEVLYRLATGQGAPPKTDSVMAGALTSDRNGDGSNGTRRSVPAPAQPAGRAIKPSPKRKPAVSKK